MLTSSNIEHGSISDSQPASIPGERNPTSSSNICKSFQPDSFYYSPCPGLYTPLFFRPKIRIGPKVDLSNHSFGRNGWKQRYITIRVKNTGHNTLHNCQAELSVLPLKNQCQSKYPSEDPKLLSWGRYPKQMNDLTITRHIQGDGSQVLHVAFSDSDFTSTQASNGLKRYACISTYECLNGNKSSRYPNTAPYLPHDDSFSDGEFIIRISITSDEGISKNKLFLLYIDSDYEKISMKALSLKKRIQRRLGLLSLQSPSNETSK